MDAVLIQCIVVLYKQDPAHARSLTSLLSVCAAEPGLASKIRIAVHDNSPYPAPFENRPTLPHIDYEHFPANPGLAVAYNRALSIAQDRNIPWLLTLDQDTAVDRNFLHRLLAALESDLAAQACAFVPQLVNDGVVLSPQIVGGVLYHRLPLGFYGFSHKPLVAFNSASCLKVDSVAKIGGFPAEYWLDYLDHIVFHKLQAAGGRVFVLDARLQHSLSMQYLEAEVSIDRYVNVLAAEWRYVRDTSSLKGRLVHRTRLLKRSTLHAFRLKNKSYAFHTLRAAIQVRFPRTVPSDAGKETTPGS